MILIFTQQTTILKGYTLRLGGKKALLASGMERVDWDSQSEMVLVSETIHQGFRKPFWTLRSHVLGIAWKLKLRVCNKIHRCKKRLWVCKNALCTFGWKKWLEVVNFIFKKSTIISRLCAHFQGIDLFCCNTGLFSVVQGLDELLPLVLRECA